MDQIETKELITPISLFAISCGYSKDIMHKVGINFMSDMSML